MEMRKRQVTTAICGISAVACTEKCVGICHRIIEWKCLGGTSEGTQLLLCSIPETADEALGELCEFSHIPDFLATPFLLMNSSGWRAWVMVEVFSTLNDSMLLSQLL